MVSPYSYLAFEILLRYEKVWNLDLQLRPFFLGGVMQTTGNRPPAMVPAKAPYLFKDVYRSGAYLGLKLQQPTNFPALTLNAQRVLTYLTLQKNRAAVIALSKKLWQWYWCEDKNIALNDVLLEACIEAIPSSREEATVIVTQKSQEEHIKEALKASTAEAVRRGAFGAPTMFVRKKGDPAEAEEMYFGSDRFHLIAMHLGVPWLGPDPSNTATPSKLTANL